MVHYLGLLKKLKNPEFLISQKVRVNTAKKIAEGARNNLRTANFPNNILRQSTQEIREKDGFSRTPALRKTGNLMNSIVHKGDTVQINARNDRGEYYGQYHLSGYRIKSNKFTKAFNIKAGTRVPKRDFLPKTIKLDKKVEKDLIKHINKTLKTKTRKIGWQK